MTLADAAAVIGLIGLTISLYLVAEWWWHQLIAAWTASRPTPDGRADDLMAVADACHEDPDPELAAAYDQLGMACHRVPTAAELQADYDDRLHALITADPQLTALAELNTDVYAGLYLPENPS